MRKIPKTKLAAKYCEPKVNVLSATLKAYKNDKKMDDCEIAKQMGWQNRQTASVKLNQPAESWRLGELQKFCSIVGCPLVKAIKAFEQSI